MSDIYAIQATYFALKPYITVYADRVQVSATLGSVYRDEI